MPGGSRMIGVLRTPSMIGVLSRRGMMLMELFGAIRPLKFMTFAGYAQHGYGKDKQGENFHRAAS